MHDRRAAVLGLLIALAALVAPASAGAATLTDLGAFSQPIFVAAPPGDGSRLMVVEKGGLIRVLQGGSQSTFLDVDTAVGGIESSGEQGLLSMAFAPDYATSGLFYVYYTAADGNSNRVAEFQVSANRSVANPLSLRPVIEISHTGATNHNGGQLAFGPDGMLYLAPGDGGASAANAQDLGNLLGKLVRIDPRGGTPYSIPPGNPYDASGGERREIFDIGLRNPYRFSFDRLTGDLMIGDVGAGAVEEVTLLPAGTPGARNLGWPICEGPCPGSPPANHVAPALSYSQGSPRAVTGGVVVRDTSLPELYGCYLYGDFYEGAIRATRLAPQAQAGHGPTTGLSVDGLSSFGEDNAGRVYVTALVGGRVYRLDSTGSARAGCASALPAAGGSSVLAGADKTPPRLVTRTTRRQRVLRQRGAIGYGRCSNEACNVAMSGRLRIGRHSYALIRTVKAAKANSRVKLRVRLTKRATRALRRALRRHRRATVLVAYRARDASLNRSPLKRVRVRVRR